MKIKYLIQLFKHDISEQILKKWYTFLLIIPILLYLTIDFSEMLIQSGVQAEAGFMDQLVCIFFGVQEYIPDINPFAVDVRFLFIHLLLAYLLADYPVKDLSFGGKQIFIRVGNNNIWWYSKCIWLVCSVLLYYAVIFLSTALFTKSFTCTPHSEILMTLELTQPIKKETDYILAVLILPIITSIAISFVQMLLSILFAPVYGFLFVVLNLLLSSYFYSPYLPGNYLMYNRNALARIEGIDAGQSILICVLISVTCIVVGSHYMKKKDIL